MQLMKLHPQNSVQRKIALHAMAAALSAALASPAVALAEGSIGIAATQSSQPYRSYKNDVIPVPLITLEGERFFLRGLSVGYKLHQGAASTLSLTAAPVLNRYRSDDSSDPRMKQLHDRGFLGAAGIEWSANGELGRLTLQAQAEFTGVGGYMADVKYAYPISMGGIVLMPEIGAGYQSKEINRHYYRVSAGEAARSGLSPYSPDEGVTPYAGITLLMPLSEKWSAAATVRRSVLSDSITDSPMVNAKYQDAAIVSLSRAF